MGTLKSFTGMTKDELMKFANDPFWVRLRWILFVAFWALWVGMLVGAIYIIVKAPKCSAPQPLVWYKEGPLIVLPADIAQVNEDYVKQVKQLDGKAVIYKVPGDDTYFLQAKQADKIKRLVDQFKAANVKVVVDVTPNYVLKADPLVEGFVADEQKRTAFSWADVSGTSPPTDWVNRENQPAWQQHDKFWITSHYGEGRFDLNLSSQPARDKFKAVLTELVELGVKGVRLNDAKHYIISGEKKADVPREQIGGENFAVNEYGFYKHAYNTFQPGLNELIHDFANYVRNATDGDGFVSINENVIDPKYYELPANVLAVDIPQYGFLPKKLETGSPRQIFDELKSIYSALPTVEWPQWVYSGASYDGHLAGSEFNTFLMLLKGVPVAPLDAFAYSNHSEKFVADLTLLRKSACFMHGDLHYFMSVNDTSVGYTRFKSGNPGYFVALNPTENNVEADFSGRNDLPDELTVTVLSDNYKAEGVQLKTKMKTNKVVLSPKSAVIFTYVPKN